MAWGGTLCLRGRDQQLSGAKALHNVIACLSASIGVVQIASSPWPHMAPQPLHALLSSISHALRQKTDERARVARALCEKAACKPCSP